VAVLGPALLTGCITNKGDHLFAPPAPVAEAIAERLAAIPSLPPEDDKAILTAYPLVDAKRVERYLLANAVGTRAHLGGGGVLDALGDGSAVLRPAVHQLDSPNARQANIELAFPCVWVAPWTRGAGIASFKHTLVLTAVTRDEELLDELLAEPTITNLYIGNHPTYWIGPGVAHDGHLGEFLMRTKAVIRD
jgi:hypothetical protein